MTGAALIEASSGNLGRWRERSEHRGFGEAYHPGRPLSVWLLTIMQRPLRLGRTQALGIRRRGAWAQSESWRGMPFHCVVRRVSLQTRPTAVRSVVLMLSIRESKPKVKQLCVATNGKCMRR